MLGSRWRWSHTRRQSLCVLRWYLDCKAQSSVELGRGLDHRKTRHLFQRVRASLRFRVSPGAEGVTWSWESVWNLLVLPGRRARHRVLAQVCAAASLAHTAGLCCAGSTGTLSTRLRCRSLPSAQLSDYCAPAGLFLVRPSTLTVPIWLRVNAAVLAD